MKSKSPSKKIKGPNFNALVPRLIEQSDKYTKEIKNRMKLNSIFSEFETKASNQFNFFIKESGKRYRGTKCGYDLNTLLWNSRKRCLNEAKKILNDDFYSNEELISEREKMKRKTTEKIYNGIQDTLQKMKGINENNIYLGEINEDSSRNKKDISDFYKTFESKERLDKNKKEIKNILGYDEKNFEKTLESYKNIVKNLENSKNSEKNNNFRKKVNTNLPGMSLLNYKKYLPPIITEEEIINLNRVNLKKLLPYCRLGKSVYNKDKKGNNSFNGNQNNLAFMTEVNFNSKNNIFNNSNITCNFFNKNKTPNIVLTSATKEFSYDKIFAQKRKNIEDSLGVDNIPPLEKYEEIIKNKFESMKKERQLFNEVLYNIQKQEKMTSFERTNLRINNGFHLIKKLEKKLKEYNRSKSIV